MTAVMADRYPNAVLLSALVHGSVIGLLLMLTYLVHRQAGAPPHIFELVAGEGDNYGAKEAPALGVPGGAKIETPEPPKPEAVQPDPVPLEAVAPPKPVATNPAVKLNSMVNRIAVKNETAVKKIQEAAKIERDRITKQQFDQANKAKMASPTKDAAPPLKAPRVDSEGIAKGVVGGSTANTTGGAGGKALVRDDSSLLEAYNSLFKQRLKAAFEAPPGLSDTLAANIEVFSGSDGTLAHARITKSSGNAEFDRALLDAIAHTQMPARPDGHSDTIGFRFTMRDKDAE